MMISDKSKKIRLVVTGVLAFVVGVIGSFMMKASEKSVVTSAYTENIVSGETIVVTDYTKPVYIVSSGSKLILNNVTIGGDSITKLDTIIRVENGGCLELNGVVINDIDADYAIYSNGTIIANDLDVTSLVDCDIYSSSTESDSLILGHVNINEVNLQSGYITANGDTKIESVIDLTLGSSLEKVGGLVVKGDDTFAGYYLDKFNYVGNYVHTTEVEKDNLDCYLDYVGDPSGIVDNVKSSVLAEMETLGIATGDIILTCPGVSTKKDGVATYYFSQYCTARRYLESQSGDYYYTIDSNSYDSTKSPYKENGWVVIDNYKFIGRESDGLYEKVYGSGEYVLKTATTAINTSVVTSVNGEAEKTETITLKAGEDRLVFIEKPKQQEGYTLECSSNVTYDIIADNNILLALLLHTSKTETVATATITANFEYETQTNVVVEMETDFTYSGVDQSAALAPHYSYKGSDVELEFEIYQKDVKVDDFKSAGEYTIKFVNVSADVVLDKTEIEVEIKQKEIDVIYSDVSGLVYDGTEKVVEASLNASDICSGDDVSVILTNARNVNAGEYVALASLSNVNYVIKDGKESIDYVIDKAEVDMSGVRFESVTREYLEDNSPLRATGVPSMVDDNYDDADGYHLVGTHTFVVEFTLIDTENYKPLSVTSMTATLTITHKVISVAGVKFNDRTATYTGEAFGLEVSDLPEYVEVSYSTNSYTDVGEYDVTATLTADSTKFVLEGETTLTATLIIVQASVDMSAIKFENVTCTYDGGTKSIEISGTLPSFISVNYVNNGKINAGEYAIEAVFSCSDDNYITPEKKTAILTIERRELTISLKPYNFVYDGTLKTIEFNVGNVVVGETVNLVATNISNINASKYTATVTAVDSDNYKLPTSVAFEYEIKKAAIDMSGVVLQDIEKTYDGVEYVPQITGQLPAMVTGVDYVYDRIVNAGEYTVIASFSVNPNYIKPADYTATIVVNKKPVVVHFDNYDGLVYDGEEKYISVRIAGFVDNAVETFDIAYSSRPLNPGNYICTVTLKQNSNYVISNANTISFEILARSLTYTEDAYVLTVTTDGISATTNLKIKSEEIEDVVTERLNSMHKVSDVESFTITIDNDESQEFALKTDNVNLKTGNKICMYRLNNGELELVECRVKDGVVYFNASNNDTLILVEYSEANSGALLIVVLVVVSVIAATFAVTFFMYKRKQKLRGENNGNESQA